MRQHFLLTAKARTLSLVTVIRLTDLEAEAEFRTVRWPDTKGAAVCPHCECPTVYECRRPSGALRFRCKACRKDFSITSGTLFAFHKLPLRTYLAAIAIFVNEVKGKSALALSRDLDVQYKTAFVLSHKLREAMASELKGMRLGGEGETVEVDGGYFGGYVKPANRKENRRDRRLAKSQNGKRQVVVVVRERGGSTLPAVFRSEAAAQSWIASRVAKGTKIVADEAGSWNGLDARYEVARIDHSQAYSLDGIYSNGAESYFSRLRRGEVGHYHHIAGPYLVRYAQESAWREDHRRVANGVQVKDVAMLAMAALTSVDCAGIGSERLRRSGNASVYFAGSVQRAPRPCPTLAIAPATYMRCSAHKNERFILCRVTLSPMSNPLSAIACFTISSAATGHRQRAGSLPDTAC